MPPRDPAGLNTAPPAREFRHLLRFFKHDQSAVEGICDYVTTGIELGEPSVLALDPGRAEAVRHELCARGYPAFDKDVLILDAAAAAEAIFPGDWPDAAAFETLVRPPIESAIRRSKTGRARVFGEIVSILWRSKREAQAAQLEALWSRLGRELPFTLLCGYMIDQMECRCDLYRLVESHAAVLPNPEMAAVDGAIERAVDRILGAQASMVRSLIAEDSRLDGVPFGQAAAMWLGRHMPLVAAKVAAAAHAES